MAASPLSTVHSARQNVAAALAGIRDEAGLKNIELSARCEWSRSKTSRIARGLTLPSPADIRTWCAVCGSPDRADTLIAQVHRVQSMYREWRQLHRNGMRHVHQQSRPLYERTRVFRFYSSSVLPSLLQEQGYAQGLLRMMTAFQGTPDDVDAAVQARLSRARLLHHGPRTLCALMEETVLYHRVCSREDMTQQLRALLTMMCRPNITLGVLPFGAERTVWPGESFYVFDYAEVALETFTATITITAPGEVTSYRDAFEQLAASAVYGPQAAECIERALRALG
ncbi:helix-turn-helix domain-containing protein [Streptomyces sp. NPDC050085]|uniref:helix-turn-helix domain-containing protein n=1 Tax=Streptomyces sp. NPDC050085 TaxID=3365600 RepID=UPI003798312F